MCENMKIIVFVLSVGLIAITDANISSDLFNPNWIEYKLNYSKEYKSADDDNLRMKIFMENAKRIAEHNQLYDNGEVSYKMGINQFSDLTHDEFINQMIERPKSSSSYEIIDEYVKLPIFDELGNQTINKSIDWREHGAVTGVKDQGRCGSCWAFAAVGVIESQHFIKTGKLVSLSEQNIVDCSSNAQYRNHGCNGGWVHKAFEYVRNNNGIDSEESYPYRGVKGKCMYDQRNSAAKVSSYITIEYGNERHLTQALATIGPISVVIDARGLQHYHSGIYYNPNCDSSHTNHLVLAVGYGTDESGQDYYIIKNSWSTRYGDAGYVYMPRNRNNHCGIASFGSYPIVSSTSEVVHTRVSLILQSVITTMVLSIKLNMFY